MTNYFLIYNDCCFYEIVLLAYFFRNSVLGPQDVCYCSVDASEVLTAEGFRVRADLFLDDIAQDTVNSFIIPGGQTDGLDHDKLRNFLTSLMQKDVPIGAICGSVQLLEDYGLLENRVSVLTSDALAICDGNIVTASPNGYVDFALEMGKLLNIFQDEADLQETIDFFKYHKPCT